ncbi:hypothetical protein Tco_0526705 [Tanacetum coccineum]
MKDQATPKVNRKNWNAMMEREQGEGYSFTKKKCFVCGSLSYLIKDCDYYEKKTAREAEVKKQRVVNTGNGVAKPVWTNANRVNHSNKFVPRSVQLNAVNAVSSNVNTVRSRQPVPTKTSNSFSPKRPQMNQFNQRRDFSKATSSIRRPFATTTAQMSHSNVVTKDHTGVLKNLMGDRLPLEVAKHKVLFTETECLVVSSDFKMPDENQILLKVPRHHNMYNFDMKTPTPTKGFACLIAKATSDESKLWHRRHSMDLQMYALTSLSLISMIPYKSVLDSMLLPSTIADGTLEIHATIDTTGYTITEASIRDKLQLADASGITMLPNDEIFEGMGQMGYPTDGTFTFWKSFFTPQWRY